MVLYSGTTCPFSHRCRFVLFEKGMDFEIRDVDMYNKPEDISVMNPYGQVPILVERDLILYESNIINEYIDERFPHPQLMPGDPLIARACVCFCSISRRNCSCMCRHWSHVLPRAMKNCWTRPVPIFVIA